MQPQQPYQPGQQPGQSYPPPQAPTPPAQDYSFILDPPKSTRKSPLQFNGASLAGRLIVILVIVFIVFGLIAVFVNVFATKGSIDKAAFIAVAQDQAEILHISQTINSNLVSQDTKNAAATIQLSVMSQQTSTNTYLASHKLKIGSKELALKQSASVDQQLTAAVNNSTVDTTYNQVMTTVLQAYERDLNLAYNKDSGPIGRALLKKNYDGATLMLKQLATARGDDS